MKILLLLVLIASCGKDSSRSVPRTEVNEIKEDTYLTLVNKHRQKLGLKPLSYSFIIEDVSREHSEDMAQGYLGMGHRGWRERCKRLARELGGNGCGEIVARGQKSPEAALEAWLNSPAHRKTIETANFTATGLGVATNSKGERFWTQIFIAE